MARRSSRRHNDGWRYALGAVLIVIALSAGGGLWYAKVTIKPTPVLDKTNDCPITGPDSVTVLLIDTTDELPAIARKEVRTLLLDAAEALPDYGLLEIRLLDPVTHSGRTIFSRCNPGDGSNLSELTANPKRVRERWRQAFRKPLEEVLEGGL